MKKNQDKVFFIGAGPGDPDLITVKGKAVIEEADLIIYAGSLVNPEILKWSKAGAVLMDSAKMSLEEITSAMVGANKEGKLVARVHSGDPAIYGAIGEQIHALDREDIGYRVIPGVSSFLAAAAELKKELTVPGITQTIILSRQAGRTPTPEGESLSKLASYKATLVLFLSVGLAEDVEKELLTSYPPDTPFAIVHRATWNDQKILKGRLKELVSTIKKNKIKKTALIFLGRFLDSSDMKSKLYDKRFSHEYRKSDA